jgi:sterol desaturase/sphingolipid hydroxylase (fatty acid hydroxylase superfamily)
MEGVIQVLGEPWRLLTDPSERLWWPALIGAVVIAFVWEIVRSRGLGSIASAPKRFGAALAQPSSYVDVGFIFVRGATRAALLAAFPAAAHFIAVRTALTAFAMVGDAPVALIGGLGIASYSAVLFVASDVSRFAVHLAMHRVPALWRFHQVHHSAEVLTPLTLHRIHPVEQALQWGRGAVVIGAVAGLFAWASHGEATPLQLLGVPVVMLAFNALGANLRHSHVFLPYPRWVEHFLISPAQHQLHHAQDAAVHHSNFGSALAIWDTLLGSLRTSEQGPPARFGLPIEAQNHNPSSLISALLGPFSRPGSSSAAP